MRLLKELPVDKARLGLIWQNLGNCYFEQKEFAIALDCYRKAFHYAQDYFGQDAPMLAQFHTNIGQVLLQQEAYLSAIQHFKDALALQQLDPTADQIPTFIDEPTEVLRLLNAKGEAHLTYFQHAGKIQDLQNALVLFDYAIKIVHEIRKQYQEVASKRDLGEASYVSFSGAIKTCYLLFQQTQQASFLEKAFSYSEQSRSNLILEALNISEATSYSGIPDSLIEQEKDLKIAITFYEKKKRTASLSTSENNEELIDMYNGKIFSLKQTYQALVHHLEMTFPAYFALKYATELPALSSIQEDLLNPEHSLLEYFVADTAVFAFVLREHALQLTQIPISSDTLFAKISRLRKAIFSYYLDANQQTSDAYLETLNNYTSLAFELYEILVQPIENQLTVNVSIINGGILNYLPFEALIAKPPINITKPKSYDYLLKNYEISYAYSATLLHRIFNNTSPKYTKNLLGFAPEFSTIDRRNLAPLAHNIPEIKGIKELIKGDVYTGVAATRSTFIELASLYQIIHLSTHGQSNIDQGDYSYLAFAENPDSTQEDLLFAKDIYNLSLNADMVVLSACETGKGEALKSEGAVSLGRAFFYSGAKSILNTLWSVDDASTGDLMKLFYTDLKDGFTKSTALRKAKLSFIESGEFAHPYYWSAFMLIGDREELKLQNGMDMRLMGGIFGLGLLGVLLFFGNKFLYAERR